jgi:hypothetical protein
MRRARLTVWLLLAGCGPDEDAGVRVRVERRDDVVVAEAATPDSRVTLQATLGDAALVVAGDVDGVAFEVRLDDVVAERALSPRGELTVGTETIVLDPGEPADLAATEAGAVLAHLWLLQAHVRARMAEMTPLFAVASWTAGGADDPASWPELHTPDDIEPPGMMAGDTADLGMTCATTIECPGRAPVCATETHADVHGFCTRACWRDDDCGEGGECALELGDVPGMSKPLRSCMLRCSPEAACPGLLSCGAGFGIPTASVCRPD